MALASSGITVSAVKTALGSSNNNVGGLCSAANINCWSKWKPISLDATTLTETLLANANYGISIKYSTTAAGLLTAVQNNSNLGYVYNKPTGISTSPYRLGDFRNYHHTANIPLTTHYSDGDEVPINGVSSSYTVDLMGIESVTPDDLTSTYYLTKGHIYPSTVVNRGALITNGTYTYWSVGSIPWGNTYWQRFKGSECTVLEFLTNLADGTTSVNHTSSSTDLFYALPEPLHTISVTNTSPAGSKTVFVDVTYISYPLSGGYSSVSYDFCFSAVGEVYAGGTISNVYIGLYRDIDCTDVIIQKQLADSITVTSEGTSDNYIGILTNSTGEQCYFGVYWNYSKQWVTMPAQNLDTQV